MELTKEKMQEIIAKFDALVKRVEKDDFSKDDSDYEQVVKGDGYIDRYFWNDDVEFCITTDSYDCHSYVSDSVYVQIEDRIEYVEMYDIKEMVGR